MEIYFGIGIIGFLLVCLHIREHLELREFRNSFRNANPDHVDYLRRCGR